MAMAKLNIGTVFIWLSNVLDTEELSSQEQLVLLHLVKYLNRNFWKATKISPHKLSKILGKKDDRTVKKALNSLINKGLIIEKKGALHIGITGAEKYFAAGTEEPTGAEETENTAKTSAEPKDTKPPGKVRNLSELLQQN